MEPSRGHRGRAGLRSAVRSTPLSGEAGTRVKRFLAASVFRVILIHVRLKPDTTYVTQGSSDATYAEIAIRSSSVSFSTAGFITFAMSPFRVPCCMSYICRAM